MKFYEASTYWHLWMWYLLYLNFQIHYWPIWLSQVTINIVSRDNIDPVAFLNKKDSFYVLSTNIYIYEVLFPAPIIFQRDWFRGTVFDLKQILLQWPKHTWIRTFQKKTDIGPQMKWESKKNINLKPVFSRNNIWKLKLTTFSGQANCFSVSTMFLNLSHQGNIYKWTTFLLAGYSTMNIDQSLQL